MLYPQIAKAAGNSDVSTWMFNGMEIRTVTIDGDPWFVGSDVADALGYAKTRNAIWYHVDAEDKRKVHIPGHDGQSREEHIVNESGLYSLIFGSKLETAKKFKHWVTSEVIPAIRRTGKFDAEAQSHQLALDSYMIDDPVQRAKRWIEEHQEKLALEDRNAKLTEQNDRLASIAEQQDITIQEMKPKAEFADAIIATDQSIAVGDLATILAQNGFDIGQNRLFMWLRRNGYLVKMPGGRYNKPTARSMNMGLFEVWERTLYLRNGGVELAITPKVTPKGQQYFINLFKSGRANYR